MRCKKVFLLIILFGVLVNLGFVSAWDFNGTVHNINGTLLYDATINVTIYSFGPSGPSLIGTNVTYSNQTGGFNLSVANNETWMYKIILTHFEDNKTDGSTPIDFIGQSLPMFPYQELYSGLNVDFYLRPAGTINITAVGEEGMTNNVTSSSITNFPLNYSAGLEIINWTDSAIRWAYVNSSDALIFLNSSYNVNMTFPELNITNIRDFEQDPYNSNIYYFVNDTQIEKCNLSTGSMNCTVSSDISSRSYSQVYGIEVINSSGIIYLSVENSTPDNYLLEEYNSSLEYTGHNQLIGFAGKMELYQDNYLYIAGNDTNLGIYRLKKYSGVQAGINYLYWDSDDVSNFSQSAVIDGIDYNPFDGLWYASSNLTDNITQINFTTTSKNFQYQIKDTKLGYPIAEYFQQGGVSQATIYVPRDRNYSIMIYPGEALPVSFDWNNFSAGDDYSFTYNSNYNHSTHVLSKQFNCTDSLKWVSGYIKNSSGSVMTGVDYFKIVPYILEPGNMVYIGENGGMPYNMSAWRGNGASDVYNLTSGFYNITLPGPAENITYILFATVKSGGNYYGGYLNKSLSYGDSVSPWNFTLYPLMSDDWGSSNSNISMDNADGSFSVNISTAKQRFNLVNASNTSQLLSNISAHIEVLVDYSNYNATELTFMLDTSQQDDASFYVPLLNTSVKEVNIYSQNYAPRRIGSRTDAQIISNPNITLSTFSPGDIGGNSTIAASVQVALYKSSSICDVPNPPSSCVIADSATMNASDAEAFNPLSAVIGGGKISFRMGLLSSGIIVEYVNVDMLASGPPDALFDDNATESTSGDFESAMRFGSNGPTIYDYVLISIPYTEGNSSQTGLNESGQINMSLPYLYDENSSGVIDWNNPIWDTATNGTNGTLLAGNYSHYSEHASEWGTLLGTNICVTNQSEFNSTNPCYINTTTNRIWIRIPHFSGVKPSITGDVVAATQSNNDNNDDSSEGGSGSSNFPKIYKISQLQFKTGYTKILRTHDKIKFNIGNESHEIEPLGITKTIVKIRLSSTPQEATFSIGDKRRFDLSGDGYYDVSLVLNKIFFISSSYSKVEMTIKSIHEKITEETKKEEQSKEAAAEGKSKEEEISTTISAEKGTVIWWGILAGIVLAGLLAWFILRTRK